MPQIPSLAGLQQANSMSLLKNSPSSANMENYAGIFDGPSEGHVPSAWEQFSGDQNADRAEEAMGAGPAVDALRRLSAASRMEHTADVGAQEDDFMAHGYARGMAHANVQNQVGDVLSEGSARRETLPYMAQKLADQDRHQQEMAETRYLLPAQLKAQGDITAASVAAQGRVGAASARDASLPTRGLMDAIGALIEKTGKIPDDATIEHLKQLYAATQGQ